MIQITCFVLLSVLSRVSFGKPNIVFILADDVGWSDFKFNHKDSPIATPTIDQLSNQGVLFSQYYTHSICTPARAALMTGRYHINTGLNYVLTPGTPAGLPSDILTIPQLLKSHARYSTAMVGKWHLGHAQHKMTPIGRGFESFTGIFMWDTDSYTKQMYESPWHPPMMIDWIEEFENGTYRHFSEPLHATEAITQAAVDTIRTHSIKNIGKPLFLYVAYTAAHSPLQPLPRHVAKCQHIAHPWRRDYCGMVVGIDEGIHNITKSILNDLGNNTILIVTSDNGGSPWFGGLNTPLRGSKATPYEGGTRVPAFIVDFTSNQEYLSSGNGDSDSSDDKGSGSNSNQRVFSSLMHVSDWLPTLLSYANVPKDQLPAYLNGFDMSNAIKTLSFNINNANQRIVHPSDIVSDRDSDGWNVDNTSYYTPESVIRNLDELRIKLLQFIQNNEISEVALTSHFTQSNHINNPRQGILYELLVAEESLYNEDLVSYRIGDWKLIQGIVRDPNYYYESASNTFLNISSPTILSTIIQPIIYGFEHIFGVGRFDSARISLTHVTLQDTMTHDQKSGKEPTVRLYNIHYDPYETTNLYQEKYAVPIITLLQSKIQYYRTHQQIPTQHVWMQFDMSNIWKKTHVTGDCSMNKKISKEDCIFTHPWIDDNENPWNQTGLVHAREFLNKRYQETISSIVTGLLIIAVMYLIFRKK